MRWFMVGVVVGALFAVAVANAPRPAQANVGSYFINVSNLLGENNSFQRGYVAGVYDAVQVLAPIAGQGTALYNVAACLDRQGDTISEFETYAGGALKGAPSTGRSAADPIMAACVRR